MKHKLRNAILYYGCSKDSYNSVKDEISGSNNQFAYAFAVLSIGLLLTCIVFNPKKELFVPFGIMVGLNIAIIFITFTNFKLSRVAYRWIFFVLVLIFEIVSIYISVYLSPFNIGVLVQSSVVMMAVLFIGHPLIISGGILATSVTFVALTYVYKGQDAFTEAVINSSAFCLIAIFIHYAVSYMRIREFLQRKTAIQSGQQYLELYNSVQCGIFEFETDCHNVRFSNINSCGLKMLGYTKDDFEFNKLMKIKSICHSDDLWKTVEYFNKANKVGGSIPFEIRFFRRDKTPFWVTGVLTVTKKEGNYVTVRSVGIDIDAQRKAEDANAAKTRFLSNVSHDMRTPLNAILGITTLMRDNVTDVSIVNDIDQLQMSSKYLLELINDTLDVSRIESGAMELNPIVCWGKETLNNALAIVTPSIKAKNIQFDVDADSIEECLLYFDSARAEQVLVNIIGNAVKFTPEGGRISLKMTHIENDETHSFDRVVISDTGIGMSKSYMKRIFEPFSQESDGNTSPYQGTGLGMTISKQIVELMGGTIAVESSKGVGTAFTFTVNLPHANQKQIEEYNKTHIDKKVKTNENTLEGSNVLLCEDNEINSKIAIRMLSKYGVKVQRASDGQQGIEMFEKSKPGYYDAVLMDVRMPVIDGLDATKMIRSLNRSDSYIVPIIAMTANAFSDDVNRCLAAGMNSHIAKPVDPAVLRDVLTRAIMEYRKPQ